MCIVIDANTLASVFEEDDANHYMFEPVKKWIIDGKGKVVYGGTKYIEELGRFVRLFSILRKAGKAILIPSDLIDADAIYLSSQIQHNNFDDQHIVALLRVSGCKIICSLDRRAYPYFRHSQFFVPASKKPKIYSSQANAKLLIDRNIAAICLPCLPTTKAQRIAFGMV